MVSRRAKTSLWIALAVVFSMTIAYAHPHVFADVTIKALFDESGFIGVQNIWVFDELYSTAMIASADADGNGKLSDKELNTLKTEVLNPTAANNYFNYVLYGTKFLKPESLKNFKASMRGKKLAVSFDVGYTIPVTSEYTMLVIVISDMTNYIQMTTDMENSDVIAPDDIDVEYFSDGLDGLTLFSDFLSKIEGLYLRYKRK